MAAPQRLEPFADGKLAPSVRHQADIRFGDRWHHERRDREPGDTLAMMGLDTNVLLRHTMQDDTQQSPHRPGKRLRADMTFEAGAAKAAGITLINRHSCQAARPAALPEPGREALGSQLLAAGSHDLPKAIRAD